MVNVVVLEKLEGDMSDDPPDPDVCLFFVLIDPRLVEGLRSKIFIDFTPFTFHSNSCPCPAWIILIK
jgi:hypothetical protein